MAALTGLKVLDLSRVLAGPWCGMTLADLGAEVIKVESFDGDDTRGMGPPYIGEISAYFSCANRGKRSICIDLHKPQSTAVIHALVQQADVLIENFRTGTAERLGVGYAAMSAINPRLIYCSISGYGRTGPDAECAGYDYAVQAEGGLMAITGARDGQPNKVAVAVVDLATGQNATIAILAALQQRHGSGRGQHVASFLIRYAVELAGQYRRRGAVHRRRRTAFRQRARQHRALSGLRCGRSGLCADRGQRETLARPVHYRGSSGMGRRSAVLQQQPARPQPKIGNRNSAAHIRHATGGVLA